MTKSRRDSGVLNGVTGTLVSQTVPTTSQIHKLLPCCKPRQGSPMDRAEPLESPVKTDYEVTSPRRPRYARPQEGNEKQSHNKIPHRRCPRLAAAEHLVESLRLHTRQSYRAGNAGPCNPRGQSACRSLVCAARACHVDLKPKPRRSGRRRDGPAKQGAGNSPRKRQNSTMRDEGPIREGRASRDGGEAPMIPVHSSHGGRGKGT